MTIVTDLELPVFDLTSPELTGDVYHERLARLRERAWGGWLAGSPRSCIVLDRESGEFFLRSGATAFPGRQIAELAHLRRWRALLPRRQPGPRRVG